MAGVIFGVLGIIVGIVGAIISYFSIREARRIATLGGATKSPQLSLNYGALPLEPSTKPIRNIVYGMPAGFKREYIGVLRLVIQNHGKRAAENVKLEIVVPAGVNSGSEHLKFRPGRGVLPGVSRECFRIGKLLHVYHYIPIINPGEPVSVDEPLWLETTVEAPISTTVSTADHMKVTLKGSFTFGFVFDLVLFQKEELPFASQIELFVAEDSDVKALARRWIKIETDQEGTYPASADRKKRKAWLKKRLESKEVLVVLPVFDELKVPKTKSLQWENFDKSRRWLLTRSHGNWILSEHEWVFK